MRVALTGATGFLGLRLTRELLRQHGSLTVLAHAGSGDALRRITRFMELTDAPAELVADLPSRLRVVETDLAQPRLGLSGDVFGRLADELDVIWHSAGNIDLDDDLVNLRRVNVEGTRNVLELAAAGAREPAVHHISTAFVGGALREGVRYEDELDDTHGFENGYERSKYEAEVVVRAWSRAHGRPVVILRPSILVTDLPADPELPAHPLQFITRIATSALRGADLAGADVPDEARPVVRIKGHLRGHLNLMPVEHAAAVMVRLADRSPSAPVRTYHVVHEHDVAITVLAALVERLAPVKLRIVEKEPDDPTPLEALSDLYPGFTPYLGHRRRFDDTRVRTLLGSAPSGIHVDIDYLSAGLSVVPSARQAASAA
ncbi:SDR family oxidoreductase [Streptomyces sp. NBC_01754]|uniref:SDR family oxidoreductase n=1 Tax=Streptomyces sp. NBC_01754 TaxID=2975930 RepID=UPI002DD85B68|nr:SDR family oxidoreductase [Streptomyces sp. NBC_01754]WSC91229.1 SDR family oxidoreductase [Streptomyces sp. NBC_01754]